MKRSIVFRDVQFDTPTYLALFREAESNTHCVKWDIFEIVGTTGSDDIIVFHETNSGTDWTEDVEKAIVFASISIKWDGCSHLYFRDDGGYFHVCGYKQWENFNDVIRQLFNLSAEKMQAYDVRIQEDSFPDDA